MRTAARDRLARTLRGDAQTAFSVDVLRSHDHSFVCIPPWSRHRPTQVSLVVFQRAYRRLCVCQEPAYVRVTVAHIGLICAANGTLR